MTFNGDDFLLAGGWRIPFLISIALVAFGIWIRERLPESPDYEEKVVEAHKKSKFMDVFVHHWKGLLVVLLVAVGYNALSYIFKTFSVAYLTECQDISAHTTSGAILVAALIALVTVPLFGEACDKFGSKRVISAGAIFSAFYAFIFLYLLGTGEAWGAYGAIAIGTGVLAPMMFSAQGSFLSRQFPTNVRSSGVGIAREIGTAVAGGLAPLGALSLVVASPTNSTFGVGIVLALAGVLVVLAALGDQGKKFSDHKN